MWCDTDTIKIKLRRVRYGDTQILTLIAELALSVLPDPGSLPPAHAIRLPGSTRSTEKSPYKSINLLRHSGALTWEDGPIPMGASIFPPSSDLIGGVSVA